MLLGLLCGLTSAQEIVPPLFVPSPNPRTSALDDGGDGPVRVLRSQLVGLSRDALTTLRSAFASSSNARPRLQLNLFPDTSLPIQVRSMRATHDGVGLVVRGNPSTDPEGDVIFSIHRAALSGFVRLRNGEFYEIFVAPDGEGEIRQVEFHPTEAWADDVIVPVVDENGLVRRQPRPGATSPRVPGRTELEDAMRHSDEIAEVDVLVAYTTRAKSERGGESGILAHINTVFAQSNAAFEDSLVNLRIRLAHTVEVAYDDSSSSMSYSAALESLVGEADGKMDEVHELRATYGADLVALLVSPPGSGTAGIAYMLPNLFPGDQEGPAKSAQVFAPYAFSVSNQRYAGGTSLTFPHEIGHNLGLHHDKDHGGTTGGLHPDARGYQQKTLNPKFFDIMAYSAGCSGCTPIANFSNPNVDYQTIPTGIVDDTDGARTLNFTAPYAAAWRNPPSASCNYSASPTSVSFAASAGAHDINVSASIGCGWSAVSAADWISFPPPTSGAGAGNFTIQVAANPSSSPRTGTVTVGGRTITVTQAGAPCSYTLSTANLSVGSTADADSVSVTAPAGCSWSAASQAGWITITGGASGSGDGIVSLSFAANPQVNQRTGSVTIAGQTVTVTQAAATCAYQLSATSVSAPHGASSTAVTVSSLSGCSWSASSNSGWISVSGGASGDGNGTVTLSFAANPNTSQRVGTATIAGQTITVTQAALPCSYTLSTASISAHSGSVASSVSVTAPAGCAWTAASNAAWIHVSGGMSGSGSGSVSLAIAANPAASQRVGSVTIAGQTVTVTQAPAPCSYTLSNTSLSVPNSAGSASITVSSLAGCAWSATSNASWIAISDGAPEDGDGAVILNFTSNPSSATRTGTVTVAGQTVTITQSAAPCTYTLGSTNVSMDSNGGNASISVSTISGCSWTASSQASWIVVTGAGGGNGSVQVSVAANPTQSSRAGTVTIGGQVVTVTQQAAPPPIVCNYSIAPISMAATSSGGSYPVAVSAADTCSWNAISTIPWLSFTGGDSGIGNGSIYINIASNPETTSRTGTVTIAGQSFTVTQQGQPMAPVLSLSQTQLVLNATQGTISAESHIGVQTDTQTTNFSLAGGLPDWLMVTPSEGTTPGTISLRANAQSLCLGTYTTTIRVEAPGTVNGVVLLEVTLEVTAPDPIRATPLALSFRAIQGGSSSVQTVALRGGSGSAMMVQVMGSASWLNTSTTSAAPGWNMRATANPAGLSPGVYDATIRVQCANNGCGSILIPVRLQVTTTPLANAPQLSSGGIVNAASFAQGLSEGSWNSLFGSRLSSTSRMWNLTDFDGDQMPTSLEGVRVTVAGIAAAIHYVSPEQVNFQAPSGIGSGWVAVEVHTPLGSDLAYTYVFPEAPGLFEVDSSRQVAAVAPDGRLILNGSGGAPARPGQIVSLYGTGFGPTDPAVTSGVIFEGTAWLLAGGAVSVTIGEVAAPIHFVGLSGAGLNQINVEIPNLPAGDHDVQLMVKGKSAQFGARIAVQ